MRWTAKRAIGLVSVALLVGGVACAKNGGGSVDLRDVEITLIEAIEAAEAERPDGVALEGELEREDGEAFYTVELLEGDTLIEVIVDSDDASILEIDIEDDDEDLVEARDAAAALAASNVTLKAAIETAEEHVGGQPVEIETLPPVLAVGLETEDGPVLVRINLSDGEVMNIGDPAGDEGDDGD